MKFLGHDLENFLEKKQNLSQVLKNVKNYIENLSNDERLKIVKKLLDLENH